jgi:hypothetical protein
MSDQYYEVVIWGNSSEHGRFKARTMLVGKWVRSEGVANHPTVREAVEALKKQFKHKPYDVEFLIDVKE